MNGRIVANIVLGFYLAFCLPASNFEFSCSAAQEAGETQSDAAIELKLASSFFATPISLQATGPASVTSIKLTATIKSSRGNGTLQVNRTALKFNDFGDMETNGPLQIESLSVELKERKEKSSGFPGGRSRADEGWRMYELVMKDAPYRLILVVPKLPTDHCRFIVQDDNRMLNILTLNQARHDAEDSATESPFSENPAVEQFDISSEYVGTEIGYKLFRLQGTLGGDAKFFLDPNGISLDEWGDMNTTTLLGWGPRSVELRLRNVTDPLRQGRKLFDIAGDGPRQTQYTLVHSPNEVSHRLVVKRDGSVIFIIPMRDSVR